MVILSGTKTYEDKIIIGNKPDTIDVLKDFIFKNNNWCNYTEKVLELVTLNFTANDIIPQEFRHFTNQNTPPFRIFDITLPQCRTGFCTL